MNPLFAYKSFACNFIRWLEVVGVRWLEDVGFMNRSESPTAREFGSSLINPGVCGVFKSPVPQHTQHVELSCRLIAFWFACQCVMASGDDDSLCAPESALHGRLVGICHGKRKWSSLCTPSAFWSAQASSFALAMTYANQTTIRSILSCGTTVQWVQFDETSHSISQGQSYSYAGVFTLPSAFGCEGRASWCIRRSGTRFQCWLDSRQCSGTSYLPRPTSRAQLCGCLWPSMMPVSAQRCGFNDTNVTFSAGDWEFDFDVQFWLVKAEQLSSTLVKKNNFASHYAESAIFVAWNVPVALWKTRWSATKTIKTSAIFVPNG